MEKLPFFIHGKSITDQATAANVGAEHRLLLIARPWNFDHRSGDSGQRGCGTAVTVQRLMKQEQLVVARPRRRRFGSYLGEISPAPDNLINRDFHAKAPNVKWLTDITEFQIPAGKVHLSPIIDCFDGMVISWSIGTQPDAELVNTMLDAAIKTVTAANCPFRSRCSLSLARLANPDQRSETGSFNVAKGLLARQRRLRRLLRPDENRTLLSPRLEGYYNRTVRRRGGCLYPLVQ
jgi:transposase InsO family protein